MQANLEAVISTQDAVILGRRSYVEWARFWPTSIDNHAFATFINAVPKYVATSSPLVPEWTNSMAIDTGVVEFVQALKDQPGGDIGVHASISLAQTLLARGLVDQLKLVVAPRIAGRGRRLLETSPTTQLEVSSAVASPSGHLLLDYTVHRH
jgi:dihydrofolate reductase